LRIAPDGHLPHQVPSSGDAGRAADFHGGDDDGGPGTAVRESAKSCRGFVLRRKYSFHLIAVTFPCSCRYPLCSQLVELIRGDFVEGSEERSGRAASDRGGTARPCPLCRAL